MSVESSFVQTPLGKLYVQQCGDGPPAVLWHSLFVDSASWGDLIAKFARHRRVIVIDGPAHGRSDHVAQPFSTSDCADFVPGILSELGIDGPVDWVGNAWGGHVGLQLAARPEKLLRSLVTIGTPVRAINRRERATKIVPLVQLYRVAGPNRFIMRTLTDALLGRDAARSNPEQAERIMDAFRLAHRPSMMHAMKGLMLDRTGIEHLLPRIDIPTLMLSARDDSTGWQPPEARAAAATMPNARVDEVAGAGHVAPLLTDAPRVERLVLDFWAECAI
ncbi:alpha/beta fold hydrolase [Aldersonia kunmingensis]|uniref:alpha/beta fold hydrolase n=1 Tax=Aldersonia kunmingensis TaxID=408066 RepID=UPI00082CB3A1|nr:alpha/beta hydrolase [Aldersonia kunmingensis]